MATPDEEMQPLLRKGFGITTTWTSVALAGAVYGIGSIVHAMNVVILEKEGEEKDPGGLSKQEVTEGQTLVWVGHGLASLFVMPLSDVFSRKWTYLGTLAVLILASLCASQARSPGLFAAANFFLGSSGVCGLVGYMLVQESIASASTRVGTLVVLNVVFALCGIAVAVSTSMARSTSWRHMVLFCQVPFILILLLGRFMIIEPERSTTEKTGEAKERSEEARPLRQILGEPLLLLRLFSHVICWTATVVGYYGVAYAAGDLSSDFYADLALLYAVDLVSYGTAWWVVQAGGLVTSQVLAYVTVALALAVCAFLPTGPLRIIAAMVGRWCLNLTFTSIYLSLVESFPAECRGTAGGIVNCLARLGCAITPWFASMPLLSSCLSMSALCAMASLVSGLLPEVRDGKTETET